jgi:hypothetical protein
MQVDEWFRRYHDYPVLNGTACCAADSLSWHYVGPTEATTLHDILTHPQKCVFACVMVWFPPQMYWWWC